MFANRLKQRREEIGLTQLEAAKVIDIAPSSYSAYETGKQNPKIDVLMRICEKFEVSADWLLGVEKPISKMNNSDVLKALMSLRISGAQVLAFDINFSDIGSALGKNSYYKQEVIAVLIDGTILKPSWNSLETMEYSVNENKMPESALKTWLNAELKELSTHPRSETEPFNRYLANAIKSYLRKEKFEVKRPLFD